MLAPMNKTGAFVEFRPRRRAFAGRKRPLLTGQEWRVAFAAFGAGGLIGAGLMVERPQPNLPELIGLAEPAQSAAPQIAVPVPALEIVEAAAPAPALPQIVVEADDGVDRAAPSTNHSGPVARVVDGDTFYLQGVDTRIRLWGVDAPEREEPGFDAATEMLTQLTAGTALTCEEVDRDRYRRIVARCYTELGDDLSALMIDSGAADEYLIFTDGYYAARRLQRASQ